MRERQKQGENAHERGRKIDGLRETETRSIMREAESFERDRETKRHRGRERDGERKKHRERKRENKERYKKREKDKP